MLGFASTSAAEGPPKRLAWPDARSACAEAPGRGDDARLGQGATVADAPLALGFADHGASIAIHYSAAADKAFGFPDAGQETLVAVRSRGVEACLVEADLARPGAGR